MSHKKLPKKKLTPSQSLSGLRASVIHASNLNHTPDGKRCQGSISTFKDLPASVSANASFASSNGYLEVMSLDKSILPEHTISAAL